MTTEEFNDASARLAKSRTEFCQMIGIGRRTADNYALGKSPIPRVVALAITAIEAGLAPAGSPDAP